jgi:hypothetical protein
MLVPHYLSDLSYPQSAIKAFEQISSATGLVVPTDSLREAATKFSADLNRKISDNPELAKLVSSLEDGFSSDESSARGPRIQSPKTELPSADQIASELEDYLSLRRKQADEGQD